MKYEMKNAYEKIGILRWIILSIFMLIAQLIFKDVRFTLYVFMVGFLSHEVPTVLMGLFLVLLARTHKEDNE